MTDFKIKEQNFYEKYQNLPLEEKLSVIAKSFGYKKGYIERRLCRRKWRGYTDMFISFSDNLQLYIGTGLTPETRKKSFQIELVNVALAKYNPEMVEYCKKSAWNNLKKLEILDNAIAAEKGLKPYTLCDIELHNLTSDFAGWYQVRLLVDDKITVFKETGLNYAIKNGETEKLLNLEEYRSFVDNPDFVYHGIGRSL